ncbi:MAG: NYN domain-containing protein, partial [Actinobacteria bacterium]|nr:NYN domain-containing protein [Actinomycetota bacterium]
NVELIEIPQRSDSVRKNAADIQMAVDAMELALTRDFVSTFVIVSGDSDFTPLVSKLRELNKRVIGVGLKGSTSAMLPPACDEFIFYDRLDGAPKRAPKAGSGGASKAKKKSSGDRGGGETREKKSSQKQDLEAVKRLVTKTLAGMQSSTSGAVQASNLKRALLRKDPTFSETDYGFRGFREFISHLADEGLVTLTEGSAPGDPEVDFPTKGKDESQAFQLLREVVKDLMVELGGDPPLSGLKDQLRKRQPDFSEKEFGYAGFLQFCKAAVTKNYVEMDWEEPDEEYYLYVEDDTTPTD